MGRYDALLDDRTTVVIVVEDYLGGVKSWSTRIRKVYESHPEFNILMLEVPVYSKGATGAFQLCAPTLEDVYEVLGEIKPAIVVPNYAWEVFGVCARLISEGVQLHTVGFCRTDEEAYYGPLQWFEPLIAQFVCVSPECATKLTERIPQRREDIHVLPTGIIVPTSLNRTYQTHPVRVVYGGRMSQVQKRVLDFVPFVEALLARQVDFQLDLVGSGSQTEKLKAAIAKLPHEGRVRFQDPLAPEAMLDVWAANDIFVQVSEYEGTSNSLLESMAWGTVPVVTDASSGIRGVINEGRNGFIVPIGDMQAMADRISTLAESPETMSRVGRAAYESSKKYSIENYERTFSEILRRAARSPVRTWNKPVTLNPELEGVVRKLARRAKPMAPARDVPMAKPAPSGAGNGPIELVVAADNNFVLPLAVTVRSVLASLDAKRRVRLHVIDGGISSENWTRLDRSWRDERLTVHRLTPDLTALGHLKITGHVNALTYARLLIPELLPRDCDKAIYLDSDVVVLHDLGELWDLDVSGFHLLAAQDMTAPFMNSETALANFDRCGPYLSAVRALAEHDVYGIHPRNPYFNCGVLVLNLRRWREDGSAKAVLEFLGAHKDAVRYWDQDGINAVLHGHWAMLDPRWNQIPHIYRYPSAEDSPFAPEVFNRIISDPWIVHYATRSKPWHYDSFHPARDLFFTFADQTDWAGWRPTAPVNRLRNPELRMTGINSVAEWKTPLGGKLSAAVGPTPKIPGLQIELETPGKNVQLVQDVFRDPANTVRKFDISIQARCDEPGVMGINVYAWVGGQAQVFSRSHPGDRVWRKIEHRLNFETPPERLQVLIVLRGTATKPACVAAPLVSFESI